VPQFAYNSVIIGRDPVAVDYQGCASLNQNARKKSDTAQPKHIITAAKTGLGINNPSNIQVEAIEIKGGICCFIFREKENYLWIVKERMS